MKAPLSLRLGCLCATLGIAAFAGGCRSASDEETAEPAYVEGVSPVGMRLSPIVWGTISRFDIVSVDGKPSASKARALVPPGEHTIAIHTVAGFTGRENTATVTVDFRSGGTYMLRPTTIGGQVFAIVIDNDNGRVVFRPDLKVVQTVAPASAPTVAASAPPPPPAAAPAPSLAPVGASASSSSEIDIWPGTAPGSENATLSETWEERGGNGVTDRAVRRVSRPTIRVYLPNPQIATGAAVLLAPGGGYEHVTIDKEGNDVARWLASQGIAGIVLKYRLPKTPGQGYTVDTAMADAIQALTVVRAHAAAWGIDSARVGMMGFSAGGNMTARAAVWPDATLRPSFVALLYPAVPKDFGRVPADGPRAFIVQADDDPLGTDNAIRFYERERDAGIPADLHLFTSGGHGFGLGKPGTPTVAWPALFRGWLAANGFIPARH